MPFNSEHRVIGLYGGSFNPPHVAHVMVVAWALAQGEVNEVWVMPTGGHPFGKELVSWEDRAQMTRLAFEPLGPRVQIKEIERAPRTHYTIETLEKLRGEYPQHQWRWIMGSDTYQEAPKWREFDRVCEYAPPLIIPRMGYPLPGQEGTEPDFGLPDLSSTFIREQLGRGVDPLALVPWVPRPVAEWIKMRKLYR